MSSSALLVFRQAIATGCRKPHPCCRALSTSNYQYSMKENLPFYGLPRPVVKGNNASDEDTSTLTGRLKIAVNSAFTALANPMRDDAVAALGEVTGHVALTQMHERMINDSVGRRILREKPIVSKDTLPIEEIIASAVSEEEVKEKKGVTFGQAYGTFLKTHGFDPDERKEIRYIDDRQHAYVMLRYRQCHDFWHVLTGLPPNVLGELGLKWLELFQTGLPVAALSATVGSLRLTRTEYKMLTTKLFPWAIENASSATYLLNVYYEEELDTPIAELRRRLKIVPAPALGP